MQVGRISLLAYACVFMHTVVDAWYLQICTTIAILFVNRPLCVLHELQIKVTTLGLSVLISSMTFAVIKITKNKYYSIWKKNTTIRPLDFLIFTEVLSSFLIEVSIVTKVRYVSVSHSSEIRKDLVIFFKICSPFGMVRRPKQFFSTNTKWKAEAFSSPKYAKICSHFLRHFTKQKLLIFEGFSSKIVRNNYLHSRSFTNPAFPFQILYLFLNFLAAFSKKISYSRGVGDKETDNYFY